MRCRGQAAASMIRNPPKDCRLFWRPFQLGEIARTINDAHDLHAVFYDPVEGQPAFYHQGPRAFANLRPRPSKLRMTPQGVAPVFDRVIDSIGRCRTVRCDPLPKSPTGPNAPGAYTEPCPQLYDLAARRRRASCFSSAKSISPASPLSIPSRHAFCNQWSFSISARSRRFMKRKASCTTSLEEAYRPARHLGVDKSRKFVGQRNLDIHERASLSVSIR
jgi:hypothetical protein